MISVFIVAASPLARAGLENLLVARQIEVAGSVRALADLDGRLDDAPTDAIVIDSAGERFESFLDAIIASGVPSDFIVVLLVEPASLGASSAALGAGIRAVLPNDVSPDQLVAALQAATSGLLVMHPAQVPLTVNVNGFASAPGRSQGLDELAEALHVRAQVHHVGRALREVRGRHDHALDVFLRPAHRLHVDG